MLETRKKVDLLDLLDQAQATQRELEAKVRALDAEAQRYRYAYTLCREVLAVLAKPENWRECIIEGDVDYTFRHDADPYFNGPVNERAKRALNEAEDWVTP